MKYMTDKKINEILLRYYYVTVDAEKNKEIIIFNAFLSKKNVWSE